MISTTPCLSERRQKEAHLEALEERIEELETHIRAVANGLTAEGYARVAKILTEVLDERT